MLLSPKNSLFGTLAVSAGFAAAVGFSALAPQCIPVLGQDDSLLHVSRYFVAFFAIILVRLLLDGGMPRIRIMP